MSAPRWRIALLHGPNLDHARPPAVGPLRHADPARAGGPRARAGAPSATWPSPSSRPTTRARSWSTSTAWPARWTAPWSTPAPGPTTSGRSATRSSCWARPFVEVHLSDVEAREPHRRVSVIRDIALARRVGQGPRRLPGRPRPPPGGARMKPRTARQERLLAALAERGLGALIVTDLANVRYLTGYVGSNGVALIGAGGRVLLTDSRYAVSATRAGAGRRGRHRQARPAGRRGRAGRRRRGGRRDRRGGRRPHRRPLRPPAGAAGRPGHRAHPRAGRGAARDQGRRRGRRDAAGRGGVSTRRSRPVLAQGIVGRTEREVAFALHGAMLDEGATEPSFATIVAAGPNGARARTTCPARTPSPRTPWSSSTWARSWTATAPT